LGYDINQFHIPEHTGYMRSNFLKQKTALVGEVESEEANKENSS
jgi:hypothetical protein